MSDAAPSIRVRVASAWLRTLFWVARHAPALLRLFRPLVAIGVPIVSRKVRTNTRLNGLRVAGDSSIGFSRAVTGSFFDFIAEVASSADCSPQAVRDQVAGVEGEAAYMEVRRQKRGAVLVTAHMGSFEVGLAALTTVEPKIQVVFKRDEHDGFEQLRRPLRERLGVAECPIDDGWPVLMALRDALGRDEIVVMQADRAMPGQKSASVKVGSGTLKIPVGPVRLAQINGSPIIPVFAVREARGRFRIFLEPAIDPSADDAVEQVGKALGKFITRYPRQWLVLDAAFVEDANRGIR